MRLLKLAKSIIAAAAAVLVLSVNSYAGTWIQDSNGWWYRNDNGTYSTNTWQKINGSWYYFNSWGYMETGWKQIGGSWYYLHADGKMAHDTWIDGAYFMGADGRWVQSAAAGSSASQYIRTWRFHGIKTEEMNPNNYTKLPVVFGHSMFDYDNLMTIKDDGTVSWYIGGQDEEGTWREENGRLVCRTTDYFGDKHTRIIERDGTWLTMGVTIAEQYFLTYWTAN